MDIQELLNIGMPRQAVDDWAATWPLSQASYPEDGPFFLKPDFLQDAIETCSLQEEARPRFLECAAQARSQESLSRLLWHCHWLCHLAPRELLPEKSWNAYLEENEPLGNHFLSSFIILAALPKIRAYYQERNIPEDILRGGALAIPIWTQDYFDHKGKWGNAHASWALLHTQPTLFRLERLEFQFGAYKAPERIYRHRDTGNIAILLPPDLPVTPEGFFAQPGEPVRFHTTLTETDSPVTGYLATPDGTVADTPAALPLKQWELAVQNGDQMLNIHIPACAPLDRKACMDGIAQAREFFPKYFPDFHFKGFQCASWLLDPHLQDILPETANIPAFQKLFHLFPRSGYNDWQLRQRVFGDPDLPLDQVPQKTSLQRLCKQHIQAGVRFRSGCGFIPR